MVIQRFADELGDVVGDVGRRNQTVGGIAGSNAWWVGTDFNSTFNSTFIAGGVKLSLAALAIQGLQSTVVPELDVAEQRDEGQDDVCLLVAALRAISYL